MSTKISALKRATGAFKNAMGPKQYGVRGKPFVCQCCGYDQFRLGNIASLPGLYSLACAECSHVELFAAPPPVFDASAA